MFKKKGKENNLEEKDMNIAEKEEEIMDSYNEEEYTDDNINQMEEYEDFNEEGVLEVRKKEKRVKKILNILFTIIIIILVIIAIDVISVARYNKGPYFAICLKTHNDGGTKEYYGIGYKVIEYNQIQGRRDKEIGFWSLKYNIEPITIQDIDLSIELIENERESYLKYYKKFVRIISTLKKIDKDNNQITLGYKDDDGKYTLDIVCTLVKEQKNIDNLEIGKEITIIGTINNFKAKTDKKVNRIYISGCFAEQ